MPDDYPERVGERVFARPRTCGERPKEIISTAVFIQRPENDDCNFLMSQLSSRRWLMSLGLLLCTMGCSSEPPATIPPQARRSETPELPGAPAVQELVVWRPFFHTDGGTISAGQTVGTAFTVKATPRGAPQVVTALHLLGTESGLKRDLKPSELNDSIQAAYLTDAFGATDSTIQIGPPYEIPNLQQDEARWVDLDVIALGVGPKLPTRPLRFADTPVQVGQRVWLVTALFAGASPSQKCHPATITELTDQGEIRYRFDNPRLSLKATDGAPLLNDAGALVGIHLGGQADDGAVQGFGWAGKVLQPALASLLD